MSWRWVAVTVPKKTAKLLDVNASSADSLRSVLLDTRVDLAIGHGAIVHRA